VSDATPASDAEVRSGGAGTTRRQSAAQVDAYLNGEDWLGESVESSNRLVDLLPSTSSLPLPSPPSSKRPGVSHRLSDAFSPIDIQVAVPPDRKERSAAEEQTLIERLQSELHAESEEARASEKRTERLARLSGGLDQDVEETWLGPPPTELQLPPKDAADGPSST
jgi:hypothetical protein